MSGICIPIPEIRSGQQANITVTSTNSVQQYKLETFDCSVEGNRKADTSELLFHVLKNKIEQYDKSWELLQVFAPEGENYEVKVLFRKR